MKKIIISFCLVLLFISMMSISTACGSSNSNTNEQDITINDICGNYTCSNGELPGSATDSALGSGEYYLEIYFDEIHHCLYFKLHIFYIENGEYLYKTRTGQFNHWKSVSANDIEHQFNFETSFRLDVDGAAYYSVYLCNYIDGKLEIIFQQHPDIVYQFDSEKQKSVDEWAEYLNNSI